MYKLISEFELDDAELELELDDILNNGKLMNKLV